MHENKANFKPRSRRTDSDVVDETQEIEATSTTRFPLRSTEKFQSTVLTTRRSFSLELNIDSSSGGLKHSKLKRRHHSDPNMVEIQVETAGTLFARQKQYSVSRRGSPNQRSSLGAQEYAQPSMAELIGNHRLSLPLAEPPTPQDLQSKKSVSLNVVVAYHDQVRQLIAKRRYVKSYGCQVIPISLPETDEKVEVSYLRIKQAIGASQPDVISIEPNYANPSSPTLSQLLYRLRDEYPSCAFVFSSATHVCLDEALQHFPNAVAFYIGRNATVIDTLQAEKVMLEKLNHDKLNLIRQQYEKKLGL